ncbi:MAG: DNA ligase D [Phycisphaerales bacterium]
MKRDPLEHYHQKRDFSRTNEPRGGEDPQQTGPSSPSGRLFVVQKHAASRLHYDIRFEWDGVLKSWAVPRGPSLDPANKQLAVATEDHPMAYARFEGIIPQGEYGGGTVMVWDIGEWEPIGDPVVQLERGDFKFRLHGHKLRGAWVLARMSGKQSDDGRNWLLIKKRDEASRPISTYNVQGEEALSVLSGRTMDEIAAAADTVWRDGASQLTGNTVQHEGSLQHSSKTILNPADLPGVRTAHLVRELSPQLAVASASPPEGDDWLHEIKLDGYRMLCRIDGDDIRFITRNGNDWTSKLAPVVRAAQRLNVQQAWLDGEIVVLDSRGISDFNALQNAFKGYGQRPMVYYVFDLPFLGGFDLRNVALIERKGMLKQIIAAGPLAAPAVQYCDHIHSRGHVVFEQAAAAGAEGIISKRVRSPYQSRRSDDWLKIKATRQQEFVVGGFTDPSGSRNGFGALLLGVYDDAGALVYAGRVGTGFSDHELESLSRAMMALLTNESPFVNPTADPDWRVVHWVQPMLVGSVEFLEWTKDDVIRHPSWKGLRQDVDPPEVRREVVASSEPDRVSEKQAEPRPVRVVTPKKTTPDVSKLSREDSLIEGVRISHADRMVYPEARITKGEVAAYYAVAGPYMMQHVARRPLAVVRCPLGLAGEHFFQRERGKGWPRGISTFETEGDHGILVRDVAGLVGLAQMGVLEMHAWNCQRDRPDRPDQLVLDLDPGPGIDWADMVAASLFVRDLVADLGLTSFIKTTGGRGTHIVVPIVRRSSWEEVKTFTKAVADALARIAPRNFVATMQKDLRAGRIFVDYLRNQSGSTAVAAYSTRARESACVSMPLSWDDLRADLPPTVWTIRHAHQHLAAGDHDSWPSFADVKQSLTAAMLQRLP